MVQLGNKEQHKLITTEDYKHYAKCQLPIKDCLTCRYVWGNLTQGEQHKYRKVTRKGIQTLALYKEETN